MSSKIIAGTTSGTALNLSSDTSGQLEIQTGAGPTTAITVNSSQIVNFANAPTIAGNSFPSGSMIFLQSSNATGLSSILISNAYTGYDMFVLVANNLTCAVDSDKLNLRFRSGGSILTSGYFQGINVQAASASFSGIGGAGVSVVQMSNINIQNASTQTGSFVMYIPTPVSSNWKFVYFTGQMSNQSTNGWASNFNTGALQALEFAYGSGAFSSGTFKLYGIKNS